MKIILNETVKEANLINKKGKIISTYSYRKVLNDEFTFEDFKKDIESFNETLATFPEFDDIKEMSKVIQLHNFN